ncbi:glucan 1,4-alpha-glucosidase [Deinococcus rubellus]|uniref:Glycoside hydrolase family 15 protein n=1 Tax=Deinococcus rubellus TaxID=1889240 RepID=A0ABY5YGD8_9DEIO|nr:glycoside hydrolase family 15 protein [Deinococcus rubellus]UWX63781.1 glycoside hydrolase family 15 protein [Deinococcus rubellus]
MSQPSIQPPLHASEAPGRPGLKPTWTSSDKDAVTGALGGGRVRAAVGYGVVNEVYWPSSGEPQVRDLTFIVKTAGGWVDIKRDCTYSLTPHEDGPLISIEHRLASDPAFSLKLEILPSIENDSLLINYDLVGGTLYALLAPHLADSGEDNSAWIQGGVMYAQRGDSALAFLASGEFGKMSAGFVGVSDGWQDFNQHGEMTWQYGKAEHGTVALMAELKDAQGTLALAFAHHAPGAAIHARSGLQRPFALQREEFLASWKTWTSRLRLPDGSDEETGRARLSAQVIRVHEGSDFAGAIVASLSVPFGQAHDSLGGYHLVWPRDMVEAATGLLAVGQVNDAVRSLNYLLAAQSPDGHWPQNIFPNGEPFWSGDQLDETAFVLLLMAKLREVEQDDNFTARALEWAATRAVGYLLRHGPVSQEDRWEENSGISAYTVAIMIAGLVAATSWLTPAQTELALAVADDWNARLEGWCYVTGQDAALAGKYGVDGYYIRIAPQAAEQPGQQDVTIANTADLKVKAGGLVSLDFGYLVRVGLRQATDPRIQNSLKVVDGELRKETPSGPLYYRYQHDAYGNTADGGPFLGLNDGIGRLWPLLAGERGHLALLAGGSADEYLDAMLRSSGDGGLFPEQVWDTEPEKTFEPGKPAGSAMPLVWAHAEYLKLLWARQNGRSYETLEAVKDRYLSGSPAPKVTFWTTNAPVFRLAANLDLSVQDTQPFTLHFGFGDAGQWTSIQDKDAEEGEFGLWQVRFTARELAGRGRLNFVRRYDSGWESQNWRVELPST